MKYTVKLLLSIIISLLTGGEACAQQPALSGEAKNPLLEMAGKPFAEYHDTYMHVVGSLLHTDSLSRMRLVELFSEAATADKSGEWAFLREMVANTVRFYNSRKGGYTWTADYTAEEFSDKMLAIAQSAGQKDFPLVKIFGLYQAGEGYRVFVQNYEQAFACYLEAAAMLDTITTKEFPVRPHIYINIANLYYAFREYDDALTYYKKVAAAPDVSGNFYGSLYPAINGMALSYRNGFADYGRSDSCFTRLLELARPHEADRMIWEGITEVNIGKNYYLRGESDTALSWLIPAISKITRPNDIGILPECTANVADIYLDKGDAKTAKKYIDMALDYHHKTRIPEKGSHLYSILARYYTLIGDSRNATVYLDSTLKVTKKEHEAFSGLVLRRVEQQLRVADQKLNDQKFESEKSRSRMYRRTAILTGTALTVIFILLGMTLFFYRRKRNAYRELVRHSLQWAGIETPEEEEKKEEAMPEEVQTEVTADYHDEMIMAEIEKSMTERKIYKRTDLTLDVLAKDTGFNRYYLSRALNRCTGKNFNTYVNEYRVKEAIRIISEQNADTLTGDSIAFEVGFNDRKALHRVFKKTTGLSPGDFRKNKAE